MNHSNVHKLFDSRQRNKLSMGLFVIFAPSSVWAHPGLHHETVGLALAAAAAFLVMQGIRARRRKRELKP